MTMAVMPSPSRLSTPLPKKPSSIAALSRQQASAYGAPMPLAVAALAVELSAGRAPADVRLMPAGAFRSWDGRPTDCATWILSDEDGRRIVGQAAARDSASVIDYEHATLHAKKTGAKAPAAGWYKQLEWRPGDGLWAIGIDWTALAAQHIVDTEYRYISPVFSYDPKTGHVQRLLHAALTNDPGLDGLTDLAALAADLLLPPINPQESIFMDLLKKLLAALGLQETATEPEALAAIAGLKSHEAALSAKAALPDASQYVPMMVHAEVQRELGEARATIEDGQRTALMSAALADGRILPATETYWRGQSIATLSAYLDVAQPVAALSGMQSGGKSPENQAPAASFPVPSGYGIDADRLALHQRAVAHAAAHAMGYEQALAAVAHP